MPRTEAGAALTSQHYRSQLAVRAITLRDLMRLWPLWQGDASSFNNFVAAAVALIIANHRVSAAVAASYFQAFRVAEGVGGIAQPRLPEPPDREQLESALWVTGERMTRDAIRSGRSPKAAMRTAQVRVSGSVGRNVLRGGIDTIVLSTASDREARGWARVTAANPCAFCALLASRGPVYSEETVDFESHDHCSCSGEPSYTDSKWPGRSREFADMYQEATLEAIEAGSLRRGTSNDLLNAFRRRFESAHAP